VQPIEEWKRISPKHFHSSSTKSTSIANFGYKSSYNDTKTLADGCKYCSASMGD
jgi:hypothetical protein